MITEDIEIIEKIYTAIVGGLKEQDIMYENFEFSYKIYDEFGFREEMIILHYSNGKSVTDKGIDHDNSPDLDCYLRTLFIQMTERGDNWKSMVLKLIDGKVTTNFSYEENPPPW